MEVRTVGTEYHAAHTSVEAAFLARHAPGAFKITMISASKGGMIWRQEISAAVSDPDPD